MLTKIEKEIFQCLHEPTAPIHLRDTVRMRLLYNLSIQNIKQHKTLVCEAQEPSQSNS
jgi:hypothetical protein